MATHVRWPHRRRSRYSDDAFESEITEEIEDAAEEADDTEPTTDDISLGPGRGSALDFREEVQ